MPTYFPQVNTDGVMTQVPYRKTVSFNSLLAESPFSRPFSIAQRGGSLGSTYPTIPLTRFEVNFTAMPDADVATIKAFFASVQGRYGEFIFLDPGGNLLNNSEDFTQSNWNFSGLSHSSGAADPFGGTRGATLSGSGIFWANVVPLGSLPANFVLNTSIWVKGSGIVTVGSSVGGTPISTKSTQTGTGWTRLDWPTQINTSSPISSYFNFSSGTYTVFGPQCVPMGGPGAYKKSPDDWGYHPQCRFDTDTFSRQTVSANQNVIRLPIQETNS